jgi:hypothetical protein
VTTARRKARKNTCSYWPYKKINEWTNKKVHLYWISWNNW